MEISKLPACMFWDQLPKFVQYEVFKKLEIEDGLTLENVCKFFKHINSPLQIYYQKLCEKDFPNIGKREKITWLKLYDELIGGSLGENALKGYLLSTKILVVNDDNPNFNIYNIRLVNKTLYFTQENERLYSLDDQMQTQKVRAFDLETKKWYQLGKGGILSDKLIVRDKGKNFNLMDIKTDNQLNKLKILVLPSFLHTTKDNVCVIGLIENLNMKVWKYTILAFPMQSKTKITLKKDEKYSSTPKGLVTSFKVTGMRVVCCGQYIVAQFDDLLNIYDLKGKQVKTINTQKFYKHTKDEFQIFSSDENVLLGVAVAPDLKSRRIFKLGLEHKIFSFWPIDEFLQEKNFTLDTSEYITVMKSKGHLLVTGSSLGNINFWILGQKKPICNFKMRDTLGKILDISEGIKNIQLTGNKLIAQTESLIKIWEVQIGGRRAQEKEIIIPKEEPTEDNSKCVLF